MAKGKVLRETGNNSQRWVKRVSRLLEEKNMTQAELAEAIDVVPSTVSGWLSGIKTSTTMNPSIENFAKIAKVFGVSLDYLYGKHRAKKRNNEEICRLTGLSESALEKLIENQKLIKSPKGSLRKKKLYACNYLIEKFDNNLFLSNLYYYLFADFCFETESKETKDEIIIYLKERDDGRQPLPITGQAFNTLYFTELQYELMRLKGELE